MGYMLFHRRVSKLLPQGYSKMILSQPPLESLMGVPDEPHFPRWISYPSRIGPEDGIHSSRWEPYQRKGILAQSFPGVSIQAGYFDLAYLIRVN
jgi:hypothetical protein